MNPLSRNGDELPQAPLVLHLSRTLNLRIWPVDAPQTISTLSTVYPQHGVSFHGLSGYLLQYVEHSRVSRIALNRFYPALGLIFVLSLVSITFIWTEYPYLQSKSALAVITPILLATVLLISSSYGSDFGR